MDKIKNKINLCIKKILSSISPEIATKIMFFYNFGRMLDLENPRDINEKLQVLKLRNYYNNPLITKCVDKYLVRSYLEEINKSELLPELYAGPLYCAAELNDYWDILPNRFVIKCNHGCGYNILVSDKEKASVDVIIKKINAWLHEDYWKIYCEPQYKNVKKAFIIEEYLGDDIATYKFYCFHGKPEVMYVSSNGENGEKDLYLDYYDMNMNWIDLTLYPHLHAQVRAEKPQNYNLMVEIARELSKPFPFVRIDLYNVNGKVFFSEYTFIPTGGNYIKL